MQFVTAFSCGGQGVRRFEGETLTLFTAVLKFDSEFGGKRAGDLSTLYKIGLGPHLATMSLQPLLLLFGVLMISSTLGILPPIKLYPIKPKKFGPADAPLMVKCVVSKFWAGMKTITKVTIERSKVGAEEKFSTVAEVQGKEVKTVAGDITAVGDATGKRAQLTITYTTPTDGYCYKYKCTAEGTSKSKKPKSKDKTITVKTKGKVDCRALTNQLINLTEAIDLVEDGLDESSKKIEGSTEVISDSAQKVLDLQARIKGIYKIVSIHPLYYVPSAVYKQERVYTLSRNNVDFNLERMNNFCKRMGGYLAEIDDAEELEFVASKVASITRNLVYIGTNDVDEEGKYVHYNSKKPLPDGLKWKAGNPDNFGGDPGEDCVNLTVAGLNDLDCKRKARYICEIPIV
ncbi:collectin-11 [Plakobranchus ocellatus]|uniref:Collectin-11 n=1 Tax=Plakobranchus ocellatus TaxID=259542 RepID=A0AAV3YCK0_9GAST|nr:collectin-11 [Plakobranchus ocellatus]